VKVDEYETKAARHNGEGEAEPVEFGFYCHVYLKWNLPNKYSLPQTFQLSQFFSFFFLLLAITVSADAT
jgi:hypothetical protein